MVPADSVVCDFGGGNGHATLGLVQEYPSIKVVLQDLPDVVEQGIIVSKSICYKASDSVVHVLNRMLGSIGKPMTLNLSRMDAYNLLGLISSPSLLLQDVISIMYVRS